MDKFIDTFPAFLKYWAGAENQPVEEQIEGWARDYMAAWPALLKMQVDDYTSQMLDWRQVARERVFPHLGERLPAMQAARTALLETCQPVLDKARQCLGCDFPVTFVIYVGIGCGAGWATRLEGKPAILLGLENIAECGWSDKETLAGLAAHETGHLVHSVWRLEAGKPVGSGPWWQLYEEGFAQACESVILDTPRVHQTLRSSNDWLQWCQEHAGWLASEYLRAVEAGETVTKFFGSWFDIQGRSETGYYLGQVVIQELEKQRSLHAIAVLEDIEAHVRPILEKLAGRVGTPAARAE